MPKLLLVGHEASRTGAPYVLLSLMRWIKANTCWDLALILQAGGPLEDEFRKLGEVHVLHPPTMRLRSRLWRKLNTVLPVDEKNMLRWARKFNPDIIWGNTVNTVHLLHLLKQELNRKAICNVHELESAFFFHQYDPAALAAIDQYVVGSKAVGDFYHSTFSIPRNRISLVYDFIDPSGYPSGSSYDLRGQHGIPAGAMLVGASGTMNIRKGPDLFFQVAYQVLSQHPNTYFVWLGGNKEEFFFKEIAADLRKAGLTDRCILLENQANPLAIYRELSIFLLTSREDPFPLVCMDNAYLGNPLICFANAGGMPEFVQEDAGFVVPYLDTTAMAEKTTLLLHNQGLRERMSKVAQQRVLKTATISVAGPQIHSIIQSVR